MNWSCSLRAVLESALLRLMMLDSKEIILALLQWIRCGKGKLGHVSLILIHRGILTKVKPATTAMRRTLLSLEMVLFHWEEAMLKSR